MLCYTQQTLAGDDDQMRLNLKTGELQVVAGRRLQDECWADQSGDGSVVAWTNYDRTIPGVDNQIQASIKGHRVSLTNDPDNHHSFPSVSDDGKKIAWMWMSDADTSDRAVYLLSRP